MSGPFGAVKEQSSGLYAQSMAERGFLTIAFDPSFTGESGGSPRYVASPVCGFPRHQHDRLDVIPFDKMEAFLRQNTVIKIQRIGGEI